MQQDATMPWIYSTATNLAWSVQTIAPTTQGLDTKMRYERVTFAESPSRSPRVAWGSHVIRTCVHHNIFGSSCLILKPSCSEKPSWIASRKLSVLRLPHVWAVCLFADTGKQLRHPGWRRGICSDWAFGSEIWASRGWWGKTSTTVRGPYCLLYNC